MLRQSISSFHIHIFPPKTRHPIKRVTQNKKSLPRLQWQGDASNNVQSKSIAQETVGNGNESEWSRKNETKDLNGLDGNSNPVSRFFCKTSGSEKSIANLTAYDFRDLANNRWECQICSRPIPTWLEFSSTTFTLLRNPFKSAKSGPLGSVCRCVTVESPRRKCLHSPARFDGRASVFSTPYPVPGTGAGAQQVVGAARRPRVLAEDSLIK